MKFLGDNWVAKLGIALLVAVLCFGGYWVYKAGENMAVKKKMDNVLTEQYRAPTPDAWKKAYEKLGVPYSPERKLTTVEMKRYIDMAWDNGKGIRSADPNL